MKDTKAKATPSEKALIELICKWQAATIKHDEAIQESGVIGAGYSVTRAPGLAGAATKAFKRIVIMYIALHPEQKEDWDMRLPAVIRKHEATIR